MLTFTYIVSFVDRTISSCSRADQSRASLTYADRLVKAWRSASSTQLGLPRVARRPHVARGLIAPARRCGVRRAACDSRPLRQLFLAHALGVGSLRAPRRESIITIRSRETPRGAIGIYAPQLPSRRPALIVGARSSIWSRIAGRQVRMMGLGGLVCCRCSDDRRAGTTQ